MIISLESYAPPGTSTPAANKAIAVTIGRLIIYFSYSQPVAFEVPAKSAYPVVSKNAWGGTTAKHLNWIDTGTAAMKAQRIPAADFTAALELIIFQEVHR